ncbi:MAG: hypothetical protein VZQ80_08280 [Lachnospiraceae bacterium]|nr:hypothetical protein [Lachnospiraceae bacterium]
MFQQNFLLLSPAPVEQKLRAGEERFVSAKSSPFVVRTRLTKTSEGRRNACFSRNFSFCRPRLLNKNFGREKKSLFQQNPLLLSPAPVEQKLSEREESRIPVDFSLAGTN